MKAPFKVRICSITLHNIKNVNHGEVQMPHGLQKHHPFERGAELVGLYGQNGSGKTALVDALKLVQTLWQGLPLLPEQRYLVTEGQAGAEIHLQLAVE